MSEKQKPTVGSIVWHDLTVAGAPGVRDFYARVVGWKTEPLSMGDYDDYNMTQPETGEPAAGVCHARGPNASMPPQWVVYVTVADLDASIAACQELGGKIILGPRSMGDQRYCIVQDPAGAMVGLIQ